MNKQLYKNLLNNELTKIKKENRYRIFNEIKKDNSFFVIKFPINGKIISAANSLYLRLLSLINSSLVNGLINFGTNRPPSSAKPLRKTFLNEK